MIFSSMTFLFLFLPVTLLLYYFVPKKLKNGVLLLMSLLFYAWGEPVYIILMLYSILLNYSMGLLMEKEPRFRGFILFFTTLLNLFLLGFFKYYGFIVENLNAVFGLSLPIRTLALPVGISFYTFQALSYMIDLYRGRFRAQRDPVAFAAYITMFPQLIAGPIVRYEDVEAQLRQRTISFDRFGRGALRFIFGLAKKVLLANLIGSLFDTITASGAAVSTVTAWLGAIAYTFQIYYDFSGYSDMAIGLGEMLGFTFVENFNYPYFASTVTDFWRRWHISLGTWFREYVYIPLGGNRVKPLRHILNILIVWLLTGLWHGASWNFVLWGLYYGILLLLDKYIVAKLKLPGFLTRIPTLFLVIIGWVLFSSETLAGAGVTLTAMFGGASKGLLDSTALYYLRTNGPLLLLESFFAFPVAGRIYRFCEKHTLTRLLIFVFAGALLLICTAFLVTSNYNPFLYFRF